jgi:phospholipid/cholesterol/gamma-HCH transport system substrate-binding protein
METQARYIIVGVFTVLAVAAGFLFVYWLHMTGGGAGQTLYSIRFEAPVIGLRPGVTVLFNGLRVGEVRRVALDPKNPKLLSAVIAVDPATPVREDTRVGIETQGLMGSANVSLSGGVSDASPKPGLGGEPPLLVADASATAGLSQAARETLNKIDAILDDNAASLRNALANLSKFSDALARNSGRMDAILGGLEKMTAGGAPPPPPTSYDLRAPTFPSSPKSFAAEIAVPEATALVVFETQRALVSPTLGERRPVEGGQWSDNLPALVRTKIVQTLENAGFTKVNASREGFSADIQLLLDIRSFEVALDPAPVAHVDLAVKLLGADGKIVARQDFQASSPATGADARAVFTALNQAFGKAASDFAVWMRATI